MSDEANKARIVALPSDRILAPGNVRTYQIDVGAKYEQEHGEIESANITWMIRNDQSHLAVYHNSTGLVNEEPGEERGTYKIVDHYAGPSGPGRTQWNNFKWQFFGNHEVICVIKHGSASPVVVRLPQTVMRFEDVRSRGPVLAHFKDDCFRRLDHERQLLKIAQAVERNAPTESDSADRARKELDSQRELVDALTHWLPDWLRTYRRWPIKATLFVDEADDNPDLNVFLFRKSDTEWFVVDYSYPQDSDLAGRHWGKSIDEALAAWGDDSSYASGEIRYSYDAGSYGKVSQRALKTGQSFVVAVREGLGMAALGLALLGMAAVPVLGWSAGAAAVAFYASMAAATGSAVIGIADRHAEGVNDTRKDTMDVLTILANLFGVGVQGARWIVQTEVLMRVSTAVKFGRWMLIGDITANAGQGVLVTVECWEEYTKARDDTALTPFERISAMCKILAKAATNAAFTSISLHGDMRGLDAMETIAGSGKVIDLTKVMGYPYKPNKEAKVDPDVTPNQKLTPGAHNAPDPPHNPIPPGKRGMRISDDQAFLAIADEERWIILVRDSNAAAGKYIGKPGFEPKPEAVKAKTIKNEDVQAGFGSRKHEGLAAVNPENPKVRKMLRESGTTYKDCRATLKNGKPPMFIEEDNDFLIYKLDESNNKVYFFSDYDLHGVYTEVGAKVAVDPSVVDKINGAFQGKLKMIQHGAHDQWPKRNTAEAGGNRGPQPPVTAYLFDGTKVSLKTVKEMKAFYKERNIDWHAIWGNDY